MYATWWMRLVLWSVSATAECALGSAPSWRAALLLGCQVTCDWSSRLPPGSPWVSVTPSLSPWPCQPRAAGDWAHATAAEGTGSCLWLGRPNWRTSRPYSAKVSSTVSRKLTPPVAAMPNCTPLARQRGCQQWRLYPGVGKPRKGSATIWGNRWQRQWERQKHTCLGSGISLSPAPDTLYMYISSWTLSSLTVALQAAKEICNPQLAKQRLLKSNDHNTPTRIHCNAINHS